MQLTHFQVGIDRPFFLISGPCVIEGETLTQEIAGRLKEITGKLGVPFIQDKLTRDPAYNVQLGSQYLTDMLRRFGGSYELAAAAYNASARSLPGDLLHTLGRRHVLERPDAPAVISPERELSYRELYARAAWKPRRANSAGTSGWSAIIFASTSGFIRRSTRPMRCMSRTGFQ